MKTKFKFRILKIFVIGVVAALAFNLASPNFLQNNNTTVQAVGDVNVIWGVPDGQPIFVVTNAAPGDVETRTVTVTNNASSVRPIGVRGVEVGGDTLKDILQIEIKVAGSTVYGGGGSKTLAQFFAESAGPDGIPLSTLGPGASTTYTFKVTFVESAGNEFQNASVVFDLKIGIAIAVPFECQNIQLSTEPIFGTENRDVLNGTNGNDLIFAFEGGDVVNASNGDDCIVGGAGDDILHGSNGDDVIFGNEGDDKINGSNGNDLLSGGDGDDKINGNNGDDNIFGGEGNDDIDAGNGDDNVIAGGGNDKVDAGNGNDYVEGNEGNDEMHGKNGNDTLLGGADGDSANGNLGTDTCDAETETNCEL